MGTEHDMMIHAMKTQCSDQSYHRKVARARKLIFQKGKGVNGKAVGKYMDDESLVPIHVSFTV